MNFEHNQLFNQIFFLNSSLLVRKIKTLCYKLLNSIFKRVFFQGAKILLFPENGLYGGGHQRNVIVPYLEDIPDPKNESANYEELCPCSFVISLFHDKNSCFIFASAVHFQTANNNEVQKNLSCLAKKTGIYIVATMGDIKTCHFSFSNLSKSVEKCPKDGRYQFNTAVVYNTSGCLVARYHNYHLFFEKQFDTPPEVRNAVQLLSLSLFLVQKQ